MVTSNLANMCVDSLWALSPGYLSGLNNSVKTYLEASLEDRLRISAYIEENTVEAPTFEVKDGILIYPIFGQLVPRVDNFMRYMGFNSTLDIISDIERNIDSFTNAGKVIFYLNGPGGALTGIPELADLINRISKQVDTIAFSDDMIASAHYYIASATGKVIATPSTTVGSIGIIREVIKFKYSSDTILFTKGEYKAAGHPAKNLDVKEMQFFDKLVSNAYDSMVQDVARYRNKSEDDVRGTEGAYVLASMNEWFVDGLVNSLGELIHQKS